MKLTVYFGVNEVLGLQRVLGSYEGMDAHRSIADDLQTYFEFNDERKKQVNFREMRPEEKKFMGFDINEQRWRWDIDKGNLWQTDLSATEVSVLQEALRKFTRYNGGDRWRVDFKAQLEAKLPEVN